MSTKPPISLPANYSYEFYLPMYSTDDGTTWKVLEPRSNVRVAKNSIISCLPTLRDIEQMSILVRCAIATVHLKGPQPGIDYSEISYKALLSRKD